MVKPTDFTYAEDTVPPMGDGEVLIKTTHVSLDPSLRGQMENRADYAAPLEIGDVMRAGCIGVIEASNNAAFPTGTLVSGTFGMQDYVVSDGTSIPFRVFPEGTDPETALGVLGGTGMTAYFGMLDIGQPREGDTVVVSGAAGATGSVAGQIAKIKGCRVFGMAGTAEKCAWLTNELGFDGAINYKTEAVGEALDSLCPQGMGHLLRQRRRRHPRRVPGADSNRRSCGPVRRHFAVQRRGAGSGAKKLLQSGVQARPHGRVYCPRLRATFSPKLPMRCNSGSTTVCSNIAPRSSKVSRICPLR